MADAASPVTGSWIEPRVQFSRAADPGPAPRRVRFKRFERNERLETANTEMHLSARAVSFESRGVDER